MNNDICATYSVQSMLLSMGSEFGIHLRHIEKNNPLEFITLMSNNTTNATKNILQAKPLDILIAVATSRENFGERVSQILESWGNPQTLPSNVKLRFFVGANDDGSSPKEDVVRLATEAETTYVSWIYVLPEVDDLLTVRKEVAMIYAAAHSFRPSFLFKVDDDVYVNVKALLKFIGDKNPSWNQVWGRQRYENPGNPVALVAETRPKNGSYCSSRSGYLMSSMTLNITAEHLDQCVEDVDKSPHRESLWHSDIIIGLCAQKRANASCYDGHNNTLYRSK